MVALNWAVANAHNGQPELAMKRLNAIKNCPQMQEHLPFALAKAHVHQSLNQQQLALHWLDAAKNLSQHQTQQAWIQDQMDQLSLER